MICLLTVIPVRNEPNDRAEVVTQMLFGETCIKLNTPQQSNFIKVKLDFDGYEGWVDHKQLTSISEGNLEKWRQTQQYSFTLNNFIKSDNSSLVPFGAVINSSLLEHHNIQFIGDSGVRNKTQLINTSLQYLNTPYLWGGKSQFGIDCSGFVQQVYKICGFDLPRDAYQQEEIGKNISFEELQKGDLAYFGKDRVTHVGIILKDKKIIHAHGYVRISPYDKKGILNDDLQGYSHSAISYRRLT